MVTGVTGGGRGEVTHCITILKGDSAPIVELEPGAPQFSFVQQTTKGATDSESSSRRCDWKFVVRIAHTIRSPIGSLTVRGTQRYLIVTRRLSDWVWVGRRERAGSLTRAGRRRESCRHRLVRAAWIA